MRLEFLKYEIKPQIFKRFPLNWVEIFEREAPIVVEIGFGSGEFLENMAREMQDFNFVGFEMSLTSLWKAQKRFFRSGLSNVKVILGDGRFCLRELFPPNSVRKVVTNFPCPWSKKKHEKRRIIVESFFQTLGNVLEFGGEFEIATDERWYAEEVVRKVRKLWYLEVSRFSLNPERKFRTRYEMKWLSEGRKIHAISVRKVGNFEVERLLEGEESMPHRLVKKAEADVNRLEGLKNRVFKEGKKLFVIKEIFRKSDGNDRVIKVIAKDGEIQQSYFVDILDKGDRYLVKLDETTIPYRTPSVKFSVFRIAEEMMKKMG